MPVVGGRTPFCDVLGFIPEFPYSFNRSIDDGLNGDGSFLCGFHNFAFFSYTNLFLVWVLPHCFVFDLIIQTYSDQPWVERGKNDNIVGKMRRP
jgi:hypothetical protein